MYLNIVTTNKLKKQSICMKASTDREWYVLSNTNGCTWKNVMANCDTEEYDLLLTYKIPM